MLSVLAKNNGCVAEANDITAWVFPLWEVICPHQESAKTWAGESHFSDAKVQGNDLNYCVGKSSEGEIVVVAREDMPPLECKVGQYPWDKALAPF
jgi:hypothetical protein